MPRVITQVVIPPGVALSLEVVMTQEVPLPKEVAMVLNVKLLVPKDELMLILTTNLKNLLQ
jgi:hypothetical protein